MNLATLLSVILLLCATAYMLMGIRAIAMRSHDGNAAIGVLSIVISVWVAGGAIEFLASTMTAFSIGRTAYFFGMAFAPVAAFAGFRQYVGKNTPTQLIVMLLIIPVVSVVLAATNAYHHLMWGPPAIDSLGQFLTRLDQWGSWFLYVHAPYSYAVVGVAVLTLLMHSSSITPTRRNGILILFAACLVPLAATVAYDVGIGPNKFSTVPIVFAVMLPVYAWLFGGKTVVEFSPLAYETIFQHMQDPVIVIDKDQRIVGLNNCALSLLDVDKADALKRPLESVFGDGSTCVFEAIDTGEPQKMMTHSGRFLHIQVSSINANGNSATGGRVLMFRDVSDVERAQSEVRKSEQLLRTLIDHSVNGILRLRWAHDEVTGNKELRCIFANAAAGRFLSIDPDELVDRDAAKIVKIASSGMSAADMESVLQQFGDAVNAGTGIDTEVHHGIGSDSRWLRFICEPVGGDFAATLVDVTDGKAKEQHMESIARSDSLTGVLNRRGFERDATRRLSVSDDSATGALLFIDLNGFKQINDQFGHEVGDELLRSAAQRLRKSLRSCDIIGRPGGDEFVALVPDVSAQVADMLAKRLAAALGEPYGIGTEQLQCAASIGLARYPDNANTLTGLLRAADQAMYRAKARSRHVPNIRGAALLEKAM